MKPFFQKILRILRPSLDVGGVEINDNEIKFVSLSDGKISKFSAKVPPGIISEGKVIKADEVIKVLKSLHSQITQKSKKIPVVISVSDANVYTQSFTLPVLNGSNFEEAVRLNMQVISPIDFLKSYSDWEKISMSSPHEFEILSSFVNKGIIDPIYKCFNESNFLPVAIEQKGFSVVRAIQKMGIVGNQPCFVLHVGGDGVSFSIIKDQLLYFNRFSSWSSVVKQNNLEREISFVDFSNLILQETHKIINFYSSRFNDGIEKIVVLAPGLEVQVKNILQDNFSIKIESIEGNLTGIENSWLVAFGSALRGLLPRSKDVHISLAPDGTEELFLHSQILAFSSMWRTIIISVLTVATLSFVGVYLFLNFVIADSSKKLNNLSSNQNTAYYQALKNEAEMFNKNINLALTAKAQQNRLSSPIAAIFDKAGTTIKIDRILIQSTGSQSSINARAPKESDAVQFKDQIQTIHGISNADLPLSSLVQVSSDEFNFRINFSFSN